MDGEDGFAVAMDFGVRQNVGLGISILQSFNFSILFKCIFGLLSIFRGKNLYIGYFNFPYANRPYIINIIDGMLQGRTG